MTKLSLTLLCFCIFVFSIWLTRPFQQIAIADPPKTKKTRSKVTRPQPIPAIDAVAPKKTESATFAMGCFWCPDYTFGSVAGVVRTRVGYSGGTKKDPTYKSLGDHTEAIQIDYDPTKITYAQLLNIFWEHHQPGRESFSRQYKCAVFFHDKKQQQLAIESKNRVAEKINEKVVTEIIPATKFYIAEAYHQKYELRRVDDLMREFKAMYPDDKDFVNSTAAARANAYVGGHGDLDMLKTEFKDYGLSSSAQRTLLRLAE